MLHLNRYLRRVQLCHRNNSLCCLSIKGPIIVNRLSWMRGAIRHITVNNHLPPNARLPSLKQCFIAFLFICICHPWGTLFDLSPQPPLCPRGRVDLLIGSWAQTYGRTRHRPALPGDWGRPNYFFLREEQWGERRDGEGPIVPRCVKSNTVFRL